MSTQAILIVDDDPLVRDSLGALLESQNLQIFFASDGPEALEQARLLLPDIILLDVMMPGMDGFVVCHKLRQDVALAEVPIVMLTALDNREARLAGLQAGADDFLSKPFDSVELLTRLQNILRLNRYRKLLDERARFVQALEEKNRELHQLSQYLVDIQEKERRFLAAELHDDLGQMLTGLKLQIDMAASQDTAQCALTLGQARNILSELTAKIRNLSLDLRPAMLDDFGLFAALEWLFGRFTQQTQVAVKHNFSFLEEARFPRPVETAAFRVIQESLTNVARHTRVKVVEVNLSLLGDALQIEVCDRGQGFLPAQLGGMAYRTGGISGMRERVSWLGGEFAIRSAPGRGTTVVARFPLQEGMQDG